MNQRYNEACEVCKNAGKDNDVAKDAYAVACWTYNRIRETGDNTEEAWRNLLKASENSKSTAKVYDRSVRNRDRIWEEEN